MKYYKFAMVTLLACACAPVACNSGGSEERSASTNTHIASRQQALTGLTTVSTFRAGRSTNVDVGDSPAQAAFTSLQALFENGEYKELEFSVYKLEPVVVKEQVVLERAADLGLSGGATSPISNDFWQAATAGQWNLRVIRNSGAELLFDATRFHTGDSVSDVLPRDQYVEKAQNYVSSHFSLANSKVSIYPYKVSYYKNSEVEHLDDFSQRRIAAPTETTYQVGVAFNMAIDDMPVIGSGGKIAVHMDTAGDPVGHEAQIRLPTNSLGVASGADLIAPNDARIAVEERLRSEEDVDVKDYVLKRAEFGYWRAGRNNLQTVVAPHYAFIYEPAPGVDGKRVVEITPALASGNLRLAIDTDARLDLDRRKALMEGLRESDPR